MVAGFEPPEGNGGGTAGTTMGTLGSHLKADLTHANAAQKTALSNWDAPRADDFKSGVFGIEAQIGVASGCATQVASALKEYAKAWKDCDGEIDGYRREAERLQTQIEEQQKQPTLPTDPIGAPGGGGIFALQMRINTLRDQAHEARETLKKRGQQLATIIDTETDRLVPGGSKVSPDAVGRKVLGAAGMTGPNAKGQTAWDKLAAAGKQGALITKLTIDNPDGTKAGGPVTSLPLDPDLLKQMLDAARINQVDPKNYAPLLHQYWAVKAAVKAGIDLGAWDPAKGTTVNRDTISKVYKYYGSLFLKDPSKYQWAGMANMIGPSFAAGFLDLNMFKSLAQNILGPAEKLPDWAKGMLPQPLPALDTLGDLGADELKFYEKTFLSMQKKIFFDQGAMHEAYDEDGLGAIDEMRAAGLIDDRAQNAWRNIDSGDPVKIKAGNTDLLWREQNQIINKQYDQMRNHHPPEGEAMTYMMTLIGSASIPGTKTPGEYSPLGFSLEAGGDVAGVGGKAKVSVDTPLPDFNIADRDSRWKYVTEDTLPAYQKLLAEDPEKARQLVASNVDDRIDEQRLSNRWPKVVGDLATDWDIDVSTEVDLGPISIGFG